MKRARRILIYIVVSVMMTSIAFASGFTQNGDAIEKATKSVLKLYVYDKENADVNQYIATASGFVAFSSSILVTNYHVIEDAGEILAVDDLDNEYLLKYVLAADKAADIAILEFLKPTGLQPLELFPDNQLKRGSSVIAIGSPKETKNTVSRGIISNIYYDGDVPEIQIDAAISPGSSGGALFNDDGQVIGVTSGGYKPRDDYGNDTAAQNINFAVNIAVVQAMYNSWDGTRYSFRNHKTSAKMDYTNVYKTKQTQDTSIQSGETGQKEIQGGSLATVGPWTCINCGSVNTDRFCQECGSEKPNWICSCGRANSGKFCGSCGTKAEDLIASINNAWTYVNEHKFEEAIQILTNLGEFDSGSFLTSRGTHISAKKLIPEAYYAQGIYLTENNMDHDEILNAFKNAGDYSDAKDKIQAENDRYFGAFYTEGLRKFKTGEYIAAIELFEKAGDYLDAAEQIKAAYYSQAVGLLGQKKWEESRIAFGKAGDYQDAAEQIKAAHYYEGIDLLEKKKWKESRAAFGKADKYNDSATMLLKTYFAEGMEKYEKGDYQQAIALFSQAGHYPDAARYIQMSYYALGEAAYKNGQNQDAIAFLEQAGDYEQAKELNGQIRDYLNEQEYSKALGYYNSGDYSSAKDVFSKITGYKDADNLYNLASINLIKKDLANINGAGLNTRLQLSFLVNDLKPFMDMQEAQELYKEINYRQGLIAENSGALLDAVEYYENSGDFEGASKKLEEIKNRYMEKLISEKKYKDASDFFHDKMATSANEQEYLILEPGQTGNIAEYVLTLIRTMELGRNIPKGEKEYKEKYIEAVQKLEEHFGMTVDGNISLDEYILIDDALFKGTKSEKVQKLVEKLSDLSYLQTLNKDHTLYANNYVSGIRNAEKDLNLLEDGVITANEYEIIQNKKVKTSNLVVKHKVTNDTVTLTWTKVPGALVYEVYMDTATKARVTPVYKKIGETRECKWVQKNVRTGDTIKFRVKAKKYTVEFEATVYVKLPTYYKPIGAAELNKMKSDAVGFYVSMNGLRIRNWAAEIGSIYDNTNAAKSKAQRERGHDVYLLCSSGNSYVEVILEDYKNWDWDNNTQDLLGMINKITSISIKGEVQDGSLMWGDIKNIPSIVINHISWNY